MDFMLRSPVPELLRDMVQRTFTRTLPRQRGHERAGLGVLIHDAETRPPVGLTFLGLPAYVSGTCGPKKVPAHLCVPGCLLDIIATSSRVLEGPSPHGDKAEPSRKCSRFCRVPRGKGRVVRLQALCHPLVASHSHPGPAQQKPLSVCPPDPEERTGQMGEALPVCVKGGAELNGSPDPASPGSLCFWVSRSSGMAV